MHSKNIDPTAMVDPEAALSKDTLVWPECLIGPQVKSGKKVIILTKAHIFGEVEIGDNVSIGEEALLAGPLTIENNVHIAPGAIIGVIPASESELARGMIQNHACIGKGAVVLDLLCVGEYAQVFPGTQLEGDLPKHGIAWGRPAVLIGFTCECGRGYSGYRQVDFELFVGECPYCKKTGPPIRRYNLERRGCILLPNVS